MRTLSLIALLFFAAISAAEDCTKEICVERPVAEADPAKLEESHVDDQCCYTYEPGQTTAGKPAEKAGESTTTR